MSFNFSMVLYNAYDFHIVNTLQKTVTTHFRLNTFEQNVDLLFMAK